MCSLTSATVSKGKGIKVKVFRFYIAPFGLDPVPAIPFTTARPFE